MFDTLSDRFEGIFKRLRGRGRLTDKDVDEVLREIRVALLEADVNLTVVRSIVARIRERAVGEELSKALNPDQQIVKFVLEELTTALGGEALRGFSEALLIGIVAGTYSSIWISSAVALSCGLKAEHLFPTVHKDPIDQLP